MEYLISWCVLLLTHFMNLFKNESLSAYEAFVEESMN